MILRKYGLELREVELKDIEMIRKFRNSDAIREKMIYRDFITSEQQLAWFRSTRTIDHFYFIIYKNDIAIGLINGKNIDYNNRSSEGGIFIWNEAGDYETVISASIIINDWSFYVNNFQTNIAQVLKSNKQAIAYNEFMGYKRSSKKHENEGVIWMEQSKDDYTKFRGRLKKLQFDSFVVNDILTKEDIIIEEHEREYVQGLVEAFPSDMKEIYGGLLKQLK